MDTPDHTLPDIDPAGVDAQGHDLPAPVRAALSVAWPSFLMAGVLEMMVFAVVDPESLHWFEGPAIEWSRQTVYGVSFFLFWFVIALACGMSRLLNREPD